MADRGFSYILRTIRRGNQVSKAHGCRRQCASRRPITSSAFNVLQYTCAELQLNGRGQ